MRIIRDDNFKRPPWCKGLDEAGYCKAIPALLKIHDNGVCFECGRTQGFGKLDVPAPPMPPVKEQVKNFALAVSRAVKYAVEEGDPVASAGEREERMGICRTCPKMDKRSMRCTMCGCKTALKVAIKTEECPDGKW